MKKVILGMSGGVDSSVAAILLKDQGYHVHGVTLKLWKGMPETSISDAEKVAKKVGITWEFLDGVKDFDEKVICNFIDSYKCGETPNPCVECNKNAKMKILIKLMGKLKYDFVATGHYATIEKINNEYGLYKGKDEKKDQSYFLYGMNSKWLDKLIFPLGDYTKSEIREIAMNRGMEVYSKPDSEDICFIPDGHYAQFLEQSGVKSTEGNFVDVKGNLVGKHKGVHHYTVGQRKGLGLALGQKVFVTRLDVANNIVVVGMEEELYSSSAVIRDFNWLTVPKETCVLEGRTRYGGVNSPLTIKNVNGNHIVEFKIPQRAITPGQSLVVYQGGRVLGGGIIHKVL